MISRRILLAGAAGLAAGPMAGSARAGTVTDLDGQAVTVGNPERLLSLGGDVTEILVELGFGEKIVAVDTTSLYPPALVDPLPKVGYLRALGAEAILTLRPSAIIAGGDAGPPAVLRQLRAAGVPVVHTESSRKPEDLLDKVRLIGKALDAGAKAKALDDRLTKALAEAEAEVAAQPRKPRCLFVLSNQGGSLMAAGRHTAADALIGLSGGVNAFGEADGYKILTPEAAASILPDVVVVMEHTVAGPGGAAAILAQPTLAVTPAGRNKRIAVLEGGYHLQFTPRLPEAILDFSRKIRG